MKIVHCIFTMHTGGSQMLVVDILNSLCRDNEVYLIVINDEWSNDIIARLDKRIRIYFLYRPRGSKNPLYIFRLNFLLWRIDPTIIHCHEPNMVNMILFKKSLCILTVHDVGIKNLFHKNYQKLISISDAVFEDIKDRFNTSSEIIYNGIDFDKFEKSSFKEYDINKPLKLIQISRLIHEKKGQDILIKAVTELLQYNILFELYFVGDGPSLEYLENLVVREGIESMVYFLGNKDRTWIMNNLREFDLLIQPSIYEGFGLTIIEGIAAGIPVIASEGGGPSEILKKWNSIFLFRTGDSKECSLKILNVISMLENGTMTKFLEEVGKEIKSKYSLNRMVSGYLKTYLSLVN
ncbi:Glycosyltransferase involved in cell wall bisynthesis [bacterium A37T11]|nr:Glycosyltransferase involved in cell wall bisynthesis [bacterium A37T11]